MVDAERLVFTIKEAAALLSISENTLRQSIREGRIPALRVSERRIVIPVAALNKMLAEAGK